MMKLSEELLWRGFCAETTIQKPSALDTRENKQFYLGVDPSADSLTIGNLAALMMCACFIRHGYTPYLLVGGATGQIGDPKDTNERELKSLEEIEHNKQCIRDQILRVMNTKDITMVDNYDWFKDINYLTFLREIGKAFSMTQLLDRQFVQARIGEGGSGISYAEFSYTLIQGYDFLHLFREYGVALQLCGADQYGNCSSGIHLIKRLENATADVWSTPLIIDPVSGRKFGKSEGNAIWLASSNNGSGNFTSIFDFYQFWLNQSDEAVEYLLKIYTIYDKPLIDDILAKHHTHPEERLAQRMLAKGVTEVVHGEDNVSAVVQLTDLLFGNTQITQLSPVEIDNISALIPTVAIGEPLVDALVKSELASSKANARQLISSGAISLNGKKVTTTNAVVDRIAIIKRGKNKFALAK